MGAVLRVKLGGFVPAALVLAAGLVAYVAYAAGADGPMGMFGGGEETDDIARDAWVQLPVHAGLALALVVRGPRGLRWIAGFIGVLGSGLLCIWAFQLGVGNAFSLYSDLGDAALCASLALLYGAALKVTVLDVAQEPVA